MNEEKPKWWQLGVVIVALVVALVQLYRAYAGPARMSGHPSAWADAYWQESSSAPTETAWIVSDVCRNLAQLVVFAGEVERNSQPGATPPEVSVTGAAGSNGVEKYSVQLKTAGAGSCRPDFSLTGSPWDPSAYLPWAQPLGASLKLRAQTAPGDATTGSAKLITRLTEPTLNNFLQSNQILSAELTANPADPALHEQAALLLTAVAWSEAAGHYSDTRGLLDAACAHLSMAELLRGGPPTGDAGRLAQILLLVLTGREADADQKLSAFAAEPDLPFGAADWVAALRLANYGDWRQFHPDANASLLLRRSYYRSITDNVTPNFGLHFYETMTDQDVPDWARIALSRPFSVWVGNTFLQKGVTGEMKEIQQLLDAFPAGDDHRLSKAKVVELLNADNSGPWRKNGLEVVSRGLWGARAQRHLLNMVDRSYYHLQDMLGVPQEAAQWRQAFLPLAQASRLGPILSFHLAQSQSDYDAAMEGAGILVNHHPELVTAANWQDLLYQPRHWQFNTSVPIYPTWFHPWFPDGTTFDTGYRLSLDYLQRQAGPDDFAIWQKMAPRKPSIALGRLRTRYGESPPPAAARELLGAMAEYNLVCAQTLADDCKDDVAAYEEAMKTVCGLSSDQYLTLGDYLAERGRDDDAAAAYQKAVDLADDRVWVAGDVDFLVNYYYDHDRRDDALTVAKMAAEVYSCAGLDTLARLDLRMKKYPDALDVANAAYQRYGDSTMLTAVYLFWKRDGGGDDVQQEVARRLSQIFPDGIEEAHLADLAKGPAPADGVKLLYENGRVRRNGLQQFDVIVAVNGRRVRNGLQYNAALDLSPTDDIDLIFWRDGQYQEKTVHLSSRRFFVDISDDVKT